MRQVRHLSATHLHPTTPVVNRIPSSLDDGTGHRRVQVHVTLFGAPFDLDLGENVQLKSRDYREFRDGVVSPPGAGGDHKPCHFHGQIRGDQHSLVAISLCPDLSGLVQHAAGRFGLQTLTGTLCGVTHVRS